MFVRPNRRQFLQASAAAASGLAIAPRIAYADDQQGFSFILLGDLHFDKLAHHDLKWLDAEKPGDLSQIKNYSRITAEIMPQLFATVRQTVAELNQSPQTRVAFVLQVGDLVEGLCGTEELAAGQNQEATEFIDKAQLGAPFLFTKGNHDVTGDGAEAAFARVFHPFLSKQAAGFVGGGKISQACYSIEHADSQFCFFDAYSRDSLDWLETTLAQRTVKRCFVAIHPPVVPYGSRALWYLYSGAKDRSRREKLLELLGQHRALVLGGHLHKFSTIARTTPNGGRFGQVAVSSVINTPQVESKNVLSGVASYNGDQVRVEPKYSPDTESQRRAIYGEERPFIKAFDYADHPGYAVVTVRPQSVTMQVYSGISRQVWTTADLSQLVDA